MLHTYPTATNLAHSVAGKRFMMRPVCMALSASIAILLLSSCSSPSFNEAQALGEAQKIVKEQLKSPSTAQFSETRILDRTKKADGKPTYLVLTTVDAQNSFGAMLRSHFLVVIRFENEKHDRYLSYKGRSTLEIRGDTPTEEEIAVAKGMNDWSDEAAKDVGGTTVPAVKPSPPLTERPPERAKWADLESVVQADLSKRFGGHKRVWFLPDESGAGGRIMTFCVEVPDGSTRKVTEEFRADPGQDNLSEAEKKRHCFYSVEVGPPASSLPANP
ncbi:MAG TPA: hypothetical protein VGM51_06450 [Armatimonadota bacterium]